MEKIPERIFSDWKISGENSWSSKNCRKNFRSAQTDPNPYSDPDLISQKNPINLKMDPTFVQKTIPKNVKGNRNYLKWQLI